MNNDMKINRLTSQMAALKTMISMENDPVVREMLAKTEKELQDEIATLSPSAAPAETLMAAINAAGAKIDREAVKKTVLGFTRIERSNDDDEGSLARAVTSIDIAGFYSNTDPSVALRLETKAINDMIWALFQMDSYYQSQVMYRDLNAKSTWAFAEASQYNNDDRISAAAAEIEHMIDEVARRVIVHSILEKEVLLNQQELNPAIHQLQSVDQVYKRFSASAEAKEARRVALRAATRATMPTAFAMRAS